MRYRLDFQLSTSPRRHYDHDYIHSFMHTSIHPYALHYLFLTQIHFRSPLHHSTFVPWHDAWRALVSAVVRTKFCLLLITFCFLLCEDGVLRVIGAGIMLLVFFLLCFWERDGGDALSFPSPCLALL
ncbi:hypothetical protein BDV19DRAFT_155129 [Aspergillus venezuelensis]